MGVIALGLVWSVMIAAPDAARAANTCNGFVALGYEGGEGLNQVGDQLRVVLTVGAGTIRGATKARLHRVRFALDCDSGSPLGLGCADDGAVIKYLGDATIQTTCPSAFTTGHAVGTLPNELVLTPSPALDLPPEVPSFCEVSFGLEVAGLSDDATPGLIEEATGYLPGNGDLRCDNGLAAGSTQSGSLPLCPSCDDHDPCTTDSCEEGACANVPLDCDDGDACTVDACENGACVSGPLCDDHDVCTADSCQEGSCTNEPIVCDNGDACSAHSCADGPCLDGQVVCDDEDPCTTDSCESGACVNVPVGCDDNNACTTDSCEGGSCANVPLACDDNNPCTTDGCESGGCVNTTLDCNDNNACTADVCDPATGECVNDDQVTPTCNDANACTTDSCDPGTGGCVHADLVTPTCDDNNACTEGSCDPETGL
jgi:hypothetical protein